MDDDRINPPIAINFLTRTVNTKQCQKTRLLNTLDLLFFLSKALQYKIQATEYVWASYLHDLDKFTKLITVRTGILLCNSLYEKRNSIPTSSFYMPCKISIILQREKTVWPAAIMWK